ncbi:hypothetical protein EWM64_g2313, partial [Hericium alpestre]
HARYGQYLSKAEAEAFAVPSADSTAAVDAWLASHNLSATKRSPSGDWFGVQMPVEQADAVFARSLRTSGRACGRFARRPVTPSCVQSLYGLPTALATQKSNSIGVVGLDGEYANAADLKVRASPASLLIRTEYSWTYRPDLDPDTSFAVKSLDGGANPQDPELVGIEADLDVQWTVCLASGVPVTFYPVGAGANDWDVDVWIDLANALLRGETLPTVVSTSYSIDEHRVPAELAITLCNLYTQLVA